MGLEANAEVCHVQRPEATSESREAHLRVVQCARKVRRCALYFAASWVTLQPKVGDYLPPQLAAAKPH